MKLSVDCKVAYTLEMSFDQIQALYKLIYRVSDSVLKENGLKISESEAKFIEHIDKTISTSEHYPMIINGFEKWIHDEVNVDESGN